MEDITFNTIDLTAGEIQSFSETLHSLRDRFEVKIYDTYSFDMSKFELMADYDEPCIRLTANIGGLPAYPCLNFMEITYTTYGRGSGRKRTESQTWGTVTLKKDLGHVVIQAETWENRIRELLEHSAVHFENDHEFNANFFVLADDHNKAEDGLNERFRNAISSIPARDFCIEISGNLLLIGNCNLVKPDSALYMAQFIKAIADLRV